MKKILLVDDSQEFLFLISSLLKFHQLDVVNEKDPERALELVKHENFSIIITDYLMEPISGIELAKAIRDTKNNQTTPIILLTAKKLDEDEMVDCSNLHLIYISKPVMPNDLYRKVVDCLDK